MNRLRSDPLAYEPEHNEDIIMKKITTLFIGAGAALLAASPVYAVNVICSGTVTHVRVQNSGCGEENLAFRTTGSAGIYACTENSVASNLVMTAIDKNWKVFVVYDSDEVGATTCDKVPHYSLSSFIYITP